MKKAFLLFLVTVLLLTSVSCSKKEKDYSGMYSEINDLVGEYKANSISYTVVLKNEEMNLTLENEGNIVNENGVYTHNYSYQYLNKIGSGADSLISTEQGSIVGTKDEIITDGFSVSNDVRVVSLNLKDSFKTHTVTRNGDSYVMKGYIARNTIIKNTDNLDDDIRFNYELTVNSDVTKIEKIVINYLTTRFDSVTITITFSEVEK